MLAALGNVLSIVLAIGLGYALAKRGWFKGESAAVIPRLVVGVALPAYMVSTLLGGYDAAKLVALLPGLLLPAVTLVATYGIGRALAALLRMSPGRRGTFSSMFALSNAIFVGLPVNLVLFGDKSLPYVLLYYMANTTLFWTIGVYGIARDGAAVRHEARPPFFTRGSLRRIFSPPLVAFLAAIALILVGIKLPGFIMDFCRILGSMTTPLSMLFVGIVLSGVAWKTIRLDRDILLVFAGRFLVAPGLLLLIAVPSPLPLLMKEVLFVQAAMPAMTQTPILAARYGADAEFAGLGTALTTVLSLVTIPLCKVVAGAVL
ncbi:MAG TPA: AEC family transporter [Spirochaetia bacterium]|nr:AEC family transporter [Spirochaetia bacterium]